MMPCVDFLIPIPPPPPSPLSLSLISISLYRLVTENKQILGVFFLLGIGFVISTTKYQRYAYYCIISHEQLIYDEEIK